MAKSVKLGDGQPTEAELLARVTGKNRPPAPGFTPPRPAGVSGKPPIPKNVPVFTPDPAALTDMERQTLQSIGWTPGETVTGNVADVIAAVKAAGAAETEAEFAKLAASGQKPPAFAPVDADTLSPDQQAEVRRQMAETIAAGKRNAEAKANLTAASGMSDGVRAALKVAEAPTGIEVEDDRRGRAMPPDPTAPAPRLTPADTGLAATHPGSCPHCGWDQAVPDDAAVTPADKAAFLHAILGEKPFTKDFPLVGGQVTVTFRTLTAKEIDAIFAQVFHEKKKGEVMTDMDFYEKVNRYRLYLQLQSARSNSFHHDFPDGFTPQTNPGADSHYELPGNLPEGETGLRLVEQHVRDTALKSESMTRMVTTAVRMFNRVTAKLEAFADNPDFWQATGG